MSLDCPLSYPHVHVKTTCLASGFRFHPLDARCFIRLPQKRSSELRTDWNVAGFHGRYRVYHLPKLHRRNAVQTISQKDWANTSPSGLCTASIKKTGIYQLVPTVEVLE